MNGWCDRIIGFSSIPCNSNWHLSLCHGLMMVGIYFSFEFGLCRMSCSNQQDKNACKATNVLVQMGLHCDSCHHHRKNMLQRDCRPQETPGADLTQLVPWSQVLLSPGNPQMLGCDVNDSCCKPLWFWGYLLCSIFGEWLANRKVLFHFRWGHIIHAMFLWN